VKVVKGHKFLEHTADVMVEAWGKNYAEALEESALALMETIADIKKIKKDGKKVRIVEKAPNLDEIVVFSLSDVLTESEINDLFFYDCKVEKFEKIGNEWIVEMELLGRKSKKCAKTIVKGVTFCQIDVQKEQNKVKMTVVFDI